MKNIKSIIKNIAFLAVLTTAIIACENDFASVGSDIIGGDNFNTTSETFPIITYNQPLSPVQTSGLPNYLLGYYNDPVYGGSNASILSQMALSQFDPDFEGDQIILDSIVFTIPYFSNPIETDISGNTTFRLDSIYGNSSPIRLSIFESNFFLRDFDPNSEFGEDQVYFSNGSSSETEVVPRQLLEGQLLYENDSFVPNSDQIILTTTDVNTNITSISGRLAPALRIKLDNPNNFWEDLIFNREGEPEISNQNNFNDHFRGIYIKAESTSPEGSMVLINLSSAEANITLHYTPQTINDSGVAINEDPETVVLNFMGGNIINIFDNNFIPIPDGDQENGDEQLFLKGGQGSMAVINLFNGDENGNSPEFEAFKNDFANGSGGQARRLVNEAFIEFNVDQTIVNGEEPDRVFIYDLNNNIPLFDYFLDQSSTPELPEARNIHLQPLVRLNNDSDGEGQTYRIRITQHINNLILRDSTNVKLGLVVAANVDTPSVANLPLQNENQTAERLPIASILSPRGTVLIGNNNNDQSRRPVFRVFYSEPNN